jgi:hypothetical protein
MGGLGWGAIYQLSAVKALGGEFYAVDRWHHTMFGAGRTVDFGRDLGKSAHGLARFRPRLVKFTQAKGNECHKYEESSEA